MARPGAETCAAAQFSIKPRTPTTTLTARPSAHSYLHHYIEPVWEFAVASAGAYRDIVGISVKRNMTKFEHVPEPKDDEEMQMLLRHTATRLWRMGTKPNHLDAFMHDDLEAPEDELKEMIPEIEKVFERRPYFAKALLAALASTP